MNHEPTLTEVFQYTLDLSELVASLSTRLYELEQNFASHSERVQAIEQKLSTLEQDGVDQQQEPGERATPDDKTAAVHAVGGATN